MQPLTKNVSGNQVPLYVLRRISDKFIINPRATSNTLGLPNPGPDQEYLPILTETPPDHDATFTVRTQTEGPNEALHQWHITYNVTDRPVVEKIAAAENAKRLEVTKHIPPQDATEKIVLALAALFRGQKGLELTAKEQGAADWLVARASLLALNDDKLADLKASITLGQKPDLSAGWAAEAVDIPTP